MRFGLPTICSVRPVGSMPMMCDCAFLTTAVRTGATLVARIRMAPLPSMALFRFITRTSDWALFGWTGVKPTCRKILRDHHGSHGSHGGMTLRAAVMDAQGQYTRRQQIDALVCDCCQTAAVMTLDGPLVIYRDRTESERRDIASSRRLQGDWTLSQPVGVDGWQINGCPVNGPALVARENDVAALWFSGVS